MVVGRCWTALTNAVPGFEPVPEYQAILVGARSLDAAEEPALRRSSITWLPPNDARDIGGVRDAVDALAARVDVVHIHVDLDVHDPAIAPANGYAAAGGLSAEEVRQVVRVVTDRIPVASATLAAYDPAYDPQGRMRHTALELLALLARLVRLPPV
jgi:arginase